MTHTTEAAKAAEELINYAETWQYGNTTVGQAKDRATAIIQASNEAYAAARTRELVAALAALRHWEDPALSSDFDADAVSARYEDDQLNAARKRADALLATHQPTKEA